MIEKIEKIDPVINYLLLAGSIMLGGAAIIAVVIIVSIVHPNTL